jgi:hypothetical protein
MRQIHSEAVTFGPDLTFAPASNFAAESPAALPGHRKKLYKWHLVFILQKYGTYIIKKGKAKNITGNLPR